MIIMTIIFLAIFVRTLDKVTRKSKNLARYRSENNFVRILSIMSNAAKCFDVLAINFVALSNYFDDIATLFSNLCLIKFLDSSAKLLFPCIYIAR